MNVNTYTNTSTYTSASRSVIHEYTSVNTSTSRSVILLQLLEHKCIPVGIKENPTGGEWGVKGRKRKRKE